MTQQSLLIVDDEINVLKSLKRELSLLNESYQIYTAQSAQEALDVLSLNNIQVVISDQRMPGMSGTQLFAQVKSLYPYSTCMILSGYSDFAAVQEAMNQGEVYKFLNKPWKIEELVQSIQEAFEHYELQRQRANNSRLVERLLEAVMITDHEHKVESVNTAFCLAMDYSPQEIVGTYINFFDRDQVSTEEIIELYDAVRAQGVWQGDTWFKKKSGSSCFVFLSISAIRNDDGEISSYIYSFLEHTTQ